MKKNCTPICANLTSMYVNTHGEEPTGGPRWAHRSSQLHVKGVGGAALSIRGHENGQEKVQRHWPEAQFFNCNSPFRIAFRCLDFNAFHPYLTDTSECDPHVYLCPENMFLQYSLIFSFHMSEPKTSV